MVQSVKQLQCMKANGTGPMIVTTLYTQMSGSAPACSRSFQKLPTSSACRGHVLIHSCTVTRCFPTMSTLQQHYADAETNLILEKALDRPKLSFFSLEHNGSQLGDMRCFQPISHKTRVRFLGPNPSVTAIGDWSSRSVVHLCSRSFWQYPDIRSSIRRRVSKCQQ